MPVKRWQRSSRSDQKRFMRDAKAKGLNRMACLSAHEPDTSFRIPAMPYTPRMAFGLWTDSLDRRFEFLNILDIKAMIQQGFRQEKRQLAKTGKLFGVFAMTPVSRPRY